MSRSLLFLAYPDICALEDVYSAVIYVYYMFYMYTEYVDIDSTIYVSLSLYMYMLT